jgi:MFS family permease
MNGDSTDVSFLPDLTHPLELLHWAQHLFSAYLVWAVLIGAAGIVLALLMKANNPSQRDLRPWLDSYGDMTGRLRLVGISLAIVAMGGLACTTLANRYRNWETDAIARSADTVAGDTMVQTPPKVSFEEAESYTEDVRVGNRMVTLSKTRQVTRYLPLAATVVTVDVKEVAIDETVPRTGYAVAFRADYDVVNSLTRAENITFDIAPPASFSVMQDFKVVCGGKTLQPSRPGVYRFVAPFSAGERKCFAVTYKGQGAPRWVYDTSNTIVSAFKLTINTDFRDARYASGIVPTATSQANGGHVFTWQYTENVSVANPFGVFSVAPPPVSPTGRLPRLLMLAPAIFIVWLFVMQLGQGLAERQVVLAGGSFFAAMLAQTYFSRLIGAPLSWFIVGALFIVAASRLAADTRDRRNYAISALIAVWLPVMGLLVTYSGLTISIAALACVGWIASRPAQPAAAAPQP